MGQLFLSSLPARQEGWLFRLIRLCRLSKPSQVIADKNDRFIIVSGKLLDTFVTFANIYAPNIDNVKFFQHVLGMLPGLNSHPLIIGGDFNCCSDPVLDRSSTRPHVVSRSASYIREFLSEYSIGDPCCFLHPTKREYSFFSHVHHSYSSIDYFLIENVMMSKVCSCAYQSIVISDHAPLALYLSFPSVAKPRRNWRLTSTLLTNDDFVELISEQISSFLSINIFPEVSNATVWEALKAFLRGQIISFTANREKNRKYQQTHLINQFTDIDRQYATSPTPELYRERLKVKTEFDLLSTQKTVHLLQRTQSDFYEHGEKTGKLIASQLRGARAKRTIRVLPFDDGENDLGPKCDQFKI